MAEQAEQVSKAAAETVEETTKAISDVADTTTKTVSNTVSSSISNVNEVLNNKSVLYGLIVVVVVAIICAVLIYYFIVEGVFNKKSVIIEKTKVPVKGYETNEIDIESFPTSGNGSRRSMTFWVYLNDMNNGQGKFKNIFTINSKSNNEVGSPSVILDATENKMYITYDVDSQSSSRPSNINSLVSTNTGTWPAVNNDIVFIKKHGITIDYVPMQRWVHIAVVVNDGINGGTMTVYLDGEVAKSVTNGDMLDEKYGDNANNKVNINNMKLDESGKLYVGGEGTNGNAHGFNGLLSKVHIFNYDLNSNDVYNDYAKGPIDSWLAALGYGVRTPIYKL